MNKNSITLPIRDRNWTFVLMTDKAFDKLHNTAENENNTAMTLANQYVVHFRKSDWCFTDIIHELGHVYMTMNDAHVANLKPEQVEETMCQIMARNYFDIGRNASLITEKFFGRE
jgi:hypothetical protein